MTRMLVKRILLGLVILWAVSVVVFLATQALPGDAARAILGREATPERLIALREQLHLDEPLWLQYFSWLGNIFQLDLGESYANGMPVTELLSSRLTNSLALMLCATLISVPLSILVGTYSALRRDKAFDHTTSVISLVLASLPEFVVGILLVLLFSTGVLNLLPAVYVMTGSGSAWSDPVQLILPTLTMVLAVSPYIIRIMRATMIEVLESEYVQQARLKGMPERTVILRHALPNAIGPVAQVIALQLAWLAGGVVIVEFLFRFPGIGFALVDAVNNRDLPVVQTLTLAIAAVYIVVNLLADVVSLAANPKVRSAAR
ncbi:peptide/nickel transport system permease protein [Saccharopolyspora antimicrobica]|uniref:Peptide/nickel transport system permease protein n=2 Tax=Saccharopolyspora TaxID=1835 RepID=A0A1I4ZY63_9PSEU|nr:MULTISPECIES: ABC transporter permease [Saccharopolyspora]RKT83351.1 peptide/nickel transport system permease protein [Saccharopolyspora antimicrobica]SEG78239.1 peptide/nickel transport system permease protein [Saccharopolyspora kobensis]SFD04949.1 peptide/nickel transport system permease protein [Saccharopolyspora kobensis]SFN55135.1 peptide/nickel transport system permease protein [Saccharopolyspora antimicrobica]